jgi:isopentenyl-diphosphate delta-isomerase
MRKIADLEMVDVVDKDNNVLFVIAKQEAHAKGLLHRTILAQLINSSREWILVKQSSDRQDAGQYVSPVGGHIRSGESEIEALYRETFEELGLKEFRYKFVGRGIFDRHILGRHENHYFILYEIYSDKELKPGPEAESYKSFTRKEIKKLLRYDPKLFGKAFHFAIKTFHPNLLE